MGDKTRGLFHKFNVERTDGTSAHEGKHHGCDYYVLDLTHDPFALPSLVAYRNACRRKYPLLAKDLTAKIAGIRALRSSFFSRPSGHGR